MVFSSHIFLYGFLPLALSLWFITPRRAQHLVLSLLSYVFYGWANPLFVPLMICSTALDYLSGLVISGQRPSGCLWSSPAQQRDQRARLLPSREHRTGSGGTSPSQIANTPREGATPAKPQTLHRLSSASQKTMGLVQRILRWLRDDPRDRPSAVSLALPIGGSRTVLQKTALTITVLLNLSLLGFFKYYNFGIDTWNQLMHQAGWTSAAVNSTLRVTLPLGISFWTFHAISYVVDVYRGHARAIRNYVDYSCYVGMFPQLVAGPIVRFQDIAEQLSQRSSSLEKAATGIVFFSLGFSRKILLANPCGQIADLAFEADSIGTAEAWLGAVAYAFQIYFDFSGYSDMAIGLALILGFQFVKNFDSPYCATSITDFWRRWHISLSSWLRDYLYVPLGGNRKGTLRTTINLFTVMVLGGLWHGAAWTYVTWGSLHGLLLCSERLVGRRPLHARLPKPLQILLTFVLVCLTWVVFRAHSLPHAGRYMASLFSFRAPTANAALLSELLWRSDVLCLLILAAVVTWAAPSTWEFTRKITWPKAGLAIALLWAAMVGMAIQSFNPFIYFMF